MSNRRRRRPPLSSRRGPDTVISVPLGQLEDFFTDQDREDLRRVCEAEDAGDLAGALRLLRRSARVVGNGHERHLAEMVTLGNAAPPWAWGRWLCGAAYRWALRSQDRRVDPAVLQVYAHTYLDTDELDRTLGTTIAASDALVQDAVVFDLGVLDDYLDVRASPSLVTRALCVQAWSAVPVTVLQLGQLRRDRLVVTDHVAERQLEVLHTGEVLGLGRDEWVIGRPVPSGASPELVFAERPLPVGDRAGRELVRVLRSGGDLAARLEVLGSAVRRGELPPRPGAGAGAHSITYAASVREEATWQRFATGDRARPPAPRQQELMAQGLTRDTAEHLCVLELALEIAGQGIDGAVEIMAHHAVLALAWPPDVRREAAARLTGDGRRDSWRRLAECVPLHARGPFLELAEAG